MNQKEEKPVTETPFDNISPQKAEFIRRIAKEAGSKNQAELLSFLVSVNSQISRNHMEFTDEEANLLVQQLTAGLSPKEQKKIELLRQLSKMISKQPRSS